MTKPCRSIEIRAQGPDGVVGRTFFCSLVNRQIVILHGFIKKTHKTPLKELNISRKRQNGIQAKP
ncbi:MAG: type II toxin-antitoxin system RelE/ParE family toxin [Chlorobium sp.]